MKCLFDCLLIVSFSLRDLFQAFSGLDEGISLAAKMLGNTALNAVLNAQFLVQIGVFTAVPMIMGFILELGLLKVSQYIPLIFLAFILSASSNVFFHV